MTPIAEAHAVSTAAWRPRQISEAGVRRFDGHQLERIHADRRTLATTNSTDAERQSRILRSSRGK